MEHANDGILLFIDFEKAFDSVEWNFLFHVLKKINFGDNFITWVNILYTNQSLVLKIMVEFQKLARCLEE